MGEYGYYNKELTKIGTCEWMYYLRYEDRHKIEKDEHSVNPQTALNLYWRLPFPDEDSVTPGNYDPYMRTTMLAIKVDSEAIHGQTYYKHYADDFFLTEPGNLQLTHPCGLLINVPCYHGLKLPDLPREADKGFGIAWNGKDPGFLGLCGIKNDSKKGIIPLISCKYCGKLWSTDWNDIWDYIIDKELKERLEVYKLAEEARGDS